MIKQIEGTKFPLGQVVTTPGAGAMYIDGLNLVYYLIRHAGGDWGDLCDEDKQANDDALENGYRLFSSYDTDQGKLWIITEADRSATTFLQPSEY